MRPIRLTTTDASGAATSSVAAVMDINMTPFDVGFGVVVTGTVNYTVQHTFDDPFAATFSVATATWFDHADVAGETANQAGSYSFPVRAIRVKQNSGDGSTVCTVVQAGMPGQ